MDYFTRYNEILSSITQQDIVIAIGTISDDGKSVMLPSDDGEEITYVLDSTTKDTFSLLDILKLTFFKI